MSQKKLFINSIISLLVVAICLFVFIENSEGDLNFKSLLINISNGWIYLLITSILLIVSVYFRAIRWKYLFREEDGVETYSLFRYELIGYFGNNVLPLRLGELLRAYILGKRYSLSNSYVFGTIVLERILDTLTLVLLSSILFFVYPLTQMIEKYIHEILDWKVKGIAAKSS